MARHRIFPRKDSEINTYFRRVVPYLDLNKLRLLIQEAVILLLQDLLSQWTDIYSESQNPDVRTTAITLTKNTVKKELTKQLRSTYNDIPKSLLTIDDRVVLNLKERDTIMTPIALVKYAPKASLESYSHLEHLLRIVDPTNPDTKEMPYGHKVEIQMAYKTTEAPIWQEVGIASRFLYYVNFEEEDLGKTVMYRFRYINTTGKQGKWSNILTLNIS